MNGIDKKDVTTAPISHLLNFTCPKCGNHVIEEIQTNLTTATIISIVVDDDGNDLLLYGEQTKGGGYVDRYRCDRCGWTIVDDHSDFANDGLDHYALAKAIRAINEPVEAGDPVSFGDLIHRIAEVRRLVRRGIGGRMEQTMSRQSGGLRGR